MACFIWWIYWGGNVSIKGKSINTIKMDVWVEKYTYTCKLFSVKRNDQFLLDLPSTSNFLRGNCFLREKIQHMTFQLFNFRWLISFSCFWCLTRFIQCQQWLMGELKSKSKFPSPTLKSFLPLDTPTHLFAKWCLCWQTLPVMSRVSQWQWSIAQVSH